MSKQLATIEQTQKFPGLSDRYQFLSTKQAIETIESMGYLLSNATEARVRNEERRGYQKHILRFRLPEHVNASRETLQALKDRNAEFPEIVYIGSHDGRTSTRIMAGFFRVVCANGLISGNISDEMRIRHVVRIGRDPYKELEDTLRIVAERSRALTDVVERWKNTKVNEAQVIHLVNAAVNARLAESSLAKEQVKLGDTGTYQLQKAVRYQDTGEDLWSVFNRVQEKAVRSPIRVQVDTGEHAGELKTLRTPKSIDGIVRINRTLWNVAESLAA